MRPYLLLTPGPLTTTETVKKAMMGDWCTWDDDYNQGIVQNIRARLVRLAASRPDDYTAVLLQGSGTYCVEATLGTAVRPTDHLLIAANGAYGQRMGTIARYYGLPHHVLSFGETSPVSPEAVGRYLDEHPETTHVALVHCETTTGILNPLEAVARTVKERGLTLIVDAMSSFGGVPLDLSALGVDFLVSSANKCVQGVPGFGFVLARRELLAGCKGVARSLSLDLYDQWHTMEQGCGKSRFTSPTHVVRACLQALVELEEEGGIAARHARYSANHRTLVRGMQRLGFRPLLPEELRSPVITSFLYPRADFDFPGLYRRLKERGFVIYPGKISQADTFRVGTIGDVHPADFERLAAVLAELRP